MVKPHLLISALLLAVPGTAGADDDEVYGTIESRPEGDIGTWMVSGRPVEVTEDTELDEGYAPLDPGACAEVEIKRDGTAEELDSVAVGKCGN